MKNAIVNCPDTGPLESLTVMLRAAGYHVHVPSPDLLAELKPLGGLVMSNRELVEGMGYEPHFPIPTSGVGGMNFCDLYVDIKAHQTYAALCKRWPRLEGRVLWYRINGGKPEHVVRYKECSRCLGTGEYIHGNDGVDVVSWPCDKCEGRGQIVTEDCGDEVNPPCPVLTPNQWYKDEWFGQPSDDGIEWCGTKGRAYSCWPPFVQFDDYYPKYGRPDPPNKGPSYGLPICLIHNVDGWGYKDLVDPLRRLGLRVFGRGSPNWMIDHSLVPGYLSTALAYVHLKSSDAPGYALYEALAAGCPVICTRRLIWRCRMQELLIPDETCLVFDRETHDALTPDDVVRCTGEVHNHLLRLSSPSDNRRIGLAGRQRLTEVMWRQDRDLPGLKEWLVRNFPH